MIGLGERVCPKWKECFHEGCVSEKVCMNSDFWADFWRNKHKCEPPPYFKPRPADAPKKKKRTFYYGEYCVGSATNCDKKQACTLLSQCIMTLSRVKNNKELFNAMRGPKTMKEIIRILKEYDPQPMRSYYELACKHR